MKSNIHATLKQVIVWTLATLILFYSMFFFWWTTELKLWWHAPTFILHGAIFGYAIFGTLTVIGSWSKRL